MMQNNDKLWQVKTAKIYIHVSTKNLTSINGSLDAILHKEADL